MAWEQLQAAKTVSHILVGTLKGTGKRFRAAASQQTQKWLRSLVGVLWGLSRVRLE